MSRRPYGPVAWLVDDLADPAAWADALRAMEVPGVVEIVPAESTVVVRCTRERHDDIGHVVDMVVPASGTHRSDPPVTIDVVYDGPDIGALAYAAQVSIDDVVRLHASGSYDVAFCGFSPGFGYLARHRPPPARAAPGHATNLGAGRIDRCRRRLHLRVPVAITGRVVPDRTHHGSDVGRERDPPALLRPGQSVRFRRVSA